MWQFVLLLLPLQTEKKRAVGTENILLTFLSLQRKALVWMSGGFWCVSSASPVYHKIATKFHTTAQKDKITWWHFISERSKVIHHDVSVWAWTGCKQQLGCLSCAAVISVILYFSLLFFFLLVFSALVVNTSKKKCSLSTVGHRCQTMMWNWTTTKPHCVLVLATGAERFSANIRDMTGNSPLPFFNLCWKYLTPIVCTVSNLHPLTCIPPCYELFAVK